MTVAHTASSKDDSPRHWLCSHLVEIEFEGGHMPPSVGLMEEIEAESAAIAVESPYPVGAKLTIKAGNVEVAAEIVFRLPRETDFLVWARFAGGYRWDPESWKPDHLFQLPASKKKARRAARG